ncbi:penicillin-binding protein 2 [Mariprofundus ferrinatatus]|uniref:Penicillin-binding protein 2 n=1 Tax=Mariprofundus ferrinatatus TaxID=1921087 RepID=A0A2K8L3Z3_9PROT|nr:penicillin-binding protein 2 [Mariprofundus ferrinatatus]ATX80949.1 penicillin-binding protein 2 [Mariprofundus ferrinatatus]
MRKNQLESRQRFDLRMLFFYAVTPLLLGGLLLNLLQLQWSQHEKLALQADENRLNIIPVLPVRGEIVDANGNGLAVNKIAYRVLLIPERVANLDETLVQLSEALAWSPAKQVHIRKRIASARPDRPVLLDDKLQWQQVSPIASRLHRLSGVDVEAGSYRHYPYSELTAHLIGYLSLARQSDLDEGFLPTEFIGRTGAEKSFESLLHGTPGSQQEEVDALGRRIAVIKRTPSIMGKQLKLALDIDVQRAASEALGDRTGAVIVLDVESGAVISMLSQPGYDTNRFITGLESEQWQQWLNNPDKPLLNRATQAAYPPASTFKVVTGLAGLAEKASLARGDAFCPGYLELADRNLRCWKREGHGNVNMHSSLVHSCDVYFYKLADQIGMAAISDSAQQWGLGEKTGIDLSPESRGIIPAHRPNMMAEMTSQSNRRKRWFRGETMITAIGQGQLTTTPLQIARLAAAIANGGKILKPQLLADQEAELLHQAEVDPKHLEQVRKAMRDVVASPGGTAYWPLRSTPWPVAGKTGTAQVVKMAQDDEKSGKLSKQEILKRHRDHAWFMGYAPYDKPKVAFAVFVEHGGHGGSDAAPVADAIIRVLAAKEEARDEGQQL